MCGYQTCKLVAFGGFVTSIGANRRPSVSPTLNRTKRTGTNKSPKNRPPLGATTLLGFLLDKSWETTPGKQLSVIANVKRTTLPYDDIAISTEKRLSDRCFCSSDGGGVSVYIYVNMSVCCCHTAFERPPIAFLH